MEIVHVQHQVGTPIISQQRSRKEPLTTVDLMLLCSGMFLFPFLGATASNCLRSTTSRPPPPSRVAGNKRLPTLHDAWTTDGAHTYTNDITAQHGTAQQGDQGIHIFETLEFL